MQQPQFGVVSINKKINVERSLSLRSSGSLSPDRHFINFIPLWRKIERRKVRKHLVPVFV